MPAAHTDFARAFTPGTVFRDSKGAEYPVRQHHAGDLVLPTGRIVACDPGSLQWEGLDRHPPFTGGVPPGRYPVVLALSHHTHPPHTFERVAAAAIRFTDAEPVAWEMAVRPGQDVADLHANCHFGYGVDSATGCFADAQLVESLGPERELRAERMIRPAPPILTAIGYDDLLAQSTPFFRRLHDGFFGFGWRKRPPVRAVDVTGPDGVSNLIAFTSNGDGNYASYWGLDAAGEPCRLVTDFAILMESVAETLRLPLGAGDRVFRGPELFGNWIDAVRVEDEVLGPPLDDRVTLTVTLDGDGGPMASVGVRADGQDRSGWWEGGQFKCELEWPLPADAQLVVTLPGRTVPL